MVLNPIITTHPLMKVYTYVPGTINSLSRRSSLSGSRDEVRKYQLMIRKFFPKVSHGYMVSQNEDISLLCDGMKVQAHSWSEIFYKAAELSLPAECGCLILWQIVWGEMLINDKSIKLLSGFLYLLLAWCSSSLSRGAGKLQSSIL